MHPGLMLLLASSKLTLVATSVAIPGSISKTGFTSIITTGLAAATITGGIGPWTYSWTVFNQIGSLNVQVVTPTGSSTAFRILGSMTLDEGTCSAICTVTDTGNGGATTVSNVCTVNITNAS